MLPRSLFALAAALAVAACAPGADAPRNANPLSLLGTVPISPLEKVSFTLTDTRGRPFDFRAETDGRMTLLFFGYTFCPDICPVHMATLAAALDEVPSEVREQVVTVFVTVDPARDTPERLEGWLDAFDSTFIGVWGSAEDVNEALAFYRYPPTETSGDEVGYTVGHPALIYAFSPDDLGRAMYGPETPRTTWVHDLTVLAGHDWGAGAQADPTTGTAGVAAQAGGIQVLDPRVPRPPTATTTAFYFTLRNVGPEADTLLEIATDAAERSSLHDMIREGSVMRMAPLEGGIPLEPGATVRLEPGSRHGMLEGLRDLPEAGSDVTIRFRFARAGWLDVPARVVRYEDLGR